MAEAALEAAARRAEEARAALAGQEDAALREATARMEAALAAESLQSLRAAALRTPMREDDEVVARLEAAAAEAARLDRALAGAEAQAAEARRRAQEVAQIREEMRSRGVRRDHWGFNDGALVGVLIGDLLRGTLSRDGFWDRLERQRVRQHDPWGTGGGGGPWSGRWRAVERRRLGRALRWRVRHRWRLRRRRIPHRRRDGKRLGRRRVQDRRRVLITTRAHPPAASAR